MICQKKNKRLHAFCLSFLLFCLAVIPCLYSVESYASETSTISTSEYFRTHNFYDTCAYVCRKYASFPYVDYLTGSSSGITYDAFADYLESIGKSDLLQGDVIVNEASGGRGYDLPQDLRQEMLNFVQNNYIADNPQNYKECYIQSYTNLSATQFNNYAVYESVKQFIKQQDGYVLIAPNGSNGNNYVTDLYAIVIPPDVDFGLYGTVTNGLFNGVSACYNWQNTAMPWNVSNNVKRYYMNPSGQWSDASGNWSTSGGVRQVVEINNLSTFVLQKTGFGNSGRWYTLFTPKDKNELVYVFNSLNAYKNYNSGNAHAYYMPSNSQTVVPYYDGFTDKDLASAGNFYNNIVINTSGDSPTDIKKKTDNILGSLDGIFGGSDSESSSGGLFDSLGDIITGATGAISPIKEIVLGDIKELVADVFDFLPPTIITLWVSGIIFGIFFGVLKLIRG